MFRPVVPSFSFILECLMKNIVKLKRRRIQKNKLDFLKHCIYWNNKTNAHGSELPVKKKITI